MAQIRGHYTIDRLEERGVERGSAPRSSLKGRVAYDWSAVGLLGSREQRLISNNDSILYSSQRELKGEHGSAKWTQTSLICELGTWVYLKGYDMEN